MPLLYRNLTRLHTRALVSGFAQPHLTSVFRSPFYSPLASFLTMVGPGLICQGEGGVQYRLVSPLGKQIRGRNPNTWLAVDNSNSAIEYVVKRPPVDGVSDESWSNALSAFKHELDMQKAFSNDPIIRRIIDYIPDSEPGGPMMVLEAFTDSLWEARNARAFAAAEIKWIMKGVLLGIFTVHMKGLVYTGKEPIFAAGSNTIKANHSILSDLKMENVALGGFDYSKPNDNVRNLIARLADCGASKCGSSAFLHSGSDDYIVSKPSSREITSLTYRSPEVYFGKPWSQSTDIWFWGIIVSNFRRMTTAWYNLNC